MSLGHIIKALKAAKSVLISTHVSPDPDALSSELAIAMYLKALGKKVIVVNDAPMGERFNFMPGSKTIKAYHSRIKTKFDTVVVVDCGDIGRIGRVQKLIQPEHTVINIDHHITNDSFGKYNLVQPKSSSTAEIIYDLLKKSKFKLNKNVAKLLYLGIMTDTGSFRYDNTSAHTHRVAGELMKFDISVSGLYRTVYERIPLKDVELFSKVVSRFETLCQGQLVCLELKKRVVSKFSENFDLRDKIFKYLRAVSGVEVILIFTEHRKNQTRVNLRSQGKVDVAKIAYAFQGGGHSRASGCMVEGDLKEVKKKVVQYVKSFL